MSEQIKPCPFCGHQNTGFAYSRQCAMCNVCKACGPSAETPEAAIAAWNAAPRPEPARTCGTCADCYWWMDTKDGYGDCTNTLTDYGRVPRRLSACDKAQPRPATGREPRL